MAAMRHRKKGGLPEATPPRAPAAGSLTAFAQEWLRRLEERAYSSKSLDMHRWALKGFLAWSSERDLEHPEQITKSILESYQRHLFRYRQKNGQPLSVTTQRNRLGAVQRLFAWLCRENHLSANPAADLDLPRKPPRLLPKALSRDELEALFAQPDVGDVLGLRDRCILEVLYSSGLRRSEIVHLDLEDLDVSRGVLTVRQGKGGKSRVVPVGGRALHWLTRYLERGRPQLELKASERALFLSGYGERLSSGYVGNWVTRSLIGGGNCQAEGCHLLRHSCATHMLENGADI